MQIKVQYVPPLYKRKISKTNIMIRAKDYTIFDSIGYEKLLENELEINKPLNDYFNAMMAGQAFADFDKAYIVQEYVYNGQVNVNVWETNNEGKYWEIRLIYHSPFIQQVSIVDELRKNTPKNNVLLFITIDPINRVTCFQHNGLK